MFLGKRKDVNPFLFSQKATVITRNCPNDFWAGFQARHVTTFVSNTLLTNSHDARWDPRWDPPWDLVL
jgi:hypothetical protein